MIRKFNFLIWICAAYVLVFLVYMINKPVAAKIKPHEYSVIDQLNLLMPHQEDYQYLLQMQQQQIKPNNNFIKQYMRYYQLVVEHVPQQWDAYAMLGFCQFYLGKNKEAIDSLTTSLNTNPTFIGAYINLALIYSYQGQRDQALILLQRAKEIPLPMAAATIMSSSRIFGLFLPQMPGTFPENLQRYLLQEKEDIDRLITLIGNNNSIPKELRLLRII